MDIHKDARTTPHNRAEIARRVILAGQAPGAVAVAFGVCLKTVGKWVTRFERIGHRITGDRTGQSTPRSKGKKGYGWEYVHVCIDDASRISFTQIHPDEKAPGAVTHLRTSVA